MKKIYLLALTVLIVNNCKSQFVCGDTLLDTRDGKQYLTVFIGGQCWMSQNLDIGGMINSYNSFDNQTNNGIIEKYCYNNNTNSCLTYGGLYQWDEMMAYSSSDTSMIGMTQGICPEGWHIPTHFEWTTLERAICSNDSCEIYFPYDTTTTGLRGINEGGKLKESGTSLWQVPNVGATNSSGFSAIPAGTRVNIDGDFYSMETATSFWCSTSRYGSNSWYRVLSTNNSQINRFNSAKDYGRSVRCVKDTDIVSIIGLLTNEDFLDIYPNPSNGIVKIKLRTKPTYRIDIEVQTVNGQIIYKKNRVSENTTLDLTEYPKGIYFIRVSSNFFSKTEKLILE